MQVRFIEFMPLDATGDWQASAVVSQDEIVAAIDAVLPARAGRRPRARPRPTAGATWTGGARSGVIPTVTKPFCGDCDRVRLTAEGQFRTCLFATREFDLRALLRGGATDDDLAAEIEPGGRARSGPATPIGQVSFIRPNRSMSQIGG